MSRTHKPPKGAYINQLHENGYFNLMKDFLDGPPEERVYDLRQKYRGVVEKMKEDYARKHNVPSFMVQVAPTSHYCDHEQTCPLDFYANLKYLKNRPTDISLDWSVRDYIESNPQADEIIIPDLEQEIVWIDQNKMGLKADINLSGDSPVYRKIKGVMLIQANDFMRKAMPTLNSVVPAYQEKFKGNLPPYIAQVHTTDDFFYIFPLSKEVSFEELYNGEARDRSPLRNKSYSYALILALIALEKIKGGEFVKDSSKYVERGLPLNKRPRKVSKGGKFRQKYCEFQTTRFRHIETEPNTKEKKPRATPEHYTPRNVRSHYKERWVTLDYIEKYQVPDEDILDLEDRTRLYKNGEGTKLWGKIKLWYEYKQDPNLEPTQEVERYRV